MAWCSHCGRNCAISADYTTNIISCVDCGKVLSEEVYYDSHIDTLQKETSEMIYKNMIKKSQAARQYKVCEEKEMIWCPHCIIKVDTSRDHSTGIIHCVHCGKILRENIYTEKATLFRNAPKRFINKKNENKLARDVKSMKHAENTAQSAGQLFTKKVKCYSYVIGKEPAEEDFIMEDEEDAYSYSENEVCESSYHN